MHTGRQRDDGADTAVTTNKPLHAHPERRPRRHLERRAIGARPGRSSSWKDLTTRNSAHTGQRTEKPASAAGWSTRFPAGIVWPQVNVKFALCVIPEHLRTVAGAAGPNAAATERAEQVTHCLQPACLAGLAALRPALPRACFTGSPLADVATARPTRRPRQHRSAVDCGAGAGANRG